MKKATKYAVALGFVLLLGACSSSQKTDGSPDEIPSAPDAATDALPMDNPENLATAPAPTDPGATPSPGVTDASATPQADAASPAPSVATTDAPPAPIADSAVTTTPPVVAAAPEAAPATPAAPAATGDSYTVQTGDTLMKIAFDTYGDLYRWKGLYEANKDKIQDPNHIPPGVVLNLDKSVSAVSVEKSGERYLIKTGDTLGTISNQVYGTSSKWKKLWDNNKALIHDPNHIFAGFYLYYVPEAGGQPQEVTPAPISETAPAAAPAPVAAPVASADRSAASVPALPTPPSGAGTGGTATQ